MLTTLLYLQTITEAHGNVKLKLTKKKPAYLFLTQFLLFYIKICCSITLLCCRPQLPDFSKWSGNFFRSYIVTVPVYLVLEATAVVKFGLSEAQNYDIFSVMLSRGIGIFPKEAYRKHALVCNVNHVDPVVALFFPLSHFSSFTGFSYLWDVTL